MDREERGTIEVKFLSLHILTVGNVTVVKLYKGDYGNPFVLNYFARVVEW